MLPRPVEACQGIFEDLVRHRAEPIAVGNHRMGRGPAKRQVLGEAQLELLKARERTATQKRMTVGWLTPASSATPAGSNRGCGLGPQARGRRPWLPICVGSTGSRASFRERCSLHAMLRNSAQSPLRASGAAHTLGRAGPDFQVLGRGKDTNRKSGLGRLPLDVTDHNRKLCGSPRSTGKELLDDEDIGEHGGRCREELRPKRADWAPHALTLLLKLQCCLSTRISDRREIFAQEGFGHFAPRRSSSWGCFVGRFR